MGEMTCKTVKGVRVALNTGLKVTDGRTHDTRRGRERRPVLKKKKKCEKTTVRKKKLALRRIESSESSDERGKKKERSNVYKLTKGQKTSMFHEVINRR